MTNMAMASVDEFKVTEIGDIPLEWNIKKLGELGKLTDGDWILTENYSETGVRLLQVGDVGVGIFADKSNRYISLETARKLKCTFLQPNQILISRMPDPIGRACLTPALPYPTITAVDVSIMTPGEDIDIDFLVHVLNSPINLHQCERLATGATRQRVSRRNLETIFIPSPPLPEQRRIAAVLNAIQEAIAAQDDVVAAAREFKRSLMQRLFTYGPGQEPAETKETEIGEIPVHWEVDSIGHRTTVKSGTTPSRSNDKYWKDGSIPWVKTGEINYRVIETTEEFVTPLAFQETSLHLYPAGTLLLAMYGQGITRGKVALLGIEATINQACAAITPRDDSLLNTYFYCYLTSAYERLRSKSHGTHQLNLNAQIIESFCVPIPPVHEQRMIHEMLSSVDNKIAEEEDCKTALQAFFKSMLHQLMTGQTRLLSDEGLPL
jgi:type I restriction enzyme, S subunit